MKSSRGFVITLFILFGIVVQWFPSAVVLGDQATFLYLFDLPFSWEDCGDQVCETIKDYSSEREYYQFRDYLGFPIPYFTAKPVCGSEHCSVKTLFQSVWFLFDVLFFVTLTILLWQKLYQKEGKGL